MANYKEDKEAHHHRDQDCNDKWFDVIVVGGGIMGSCTAYEISRRGHSTLLLDQFDFLHNRGSSHGESRSLRITYADPYYPPLVLESCRLWERAQSEIGDRVLYPTSQLDMGPSNEPALQAIIASCRSNGVSFRVLDPLQVAHEFSGKVALPDNWIGVLSDGAAVIKPTKAVSMFQALALQNGAILRDNMKVTSITSLSNGGGGIMVSTARGDTFYGKKCVITAGAWMNKLVQAVTGRDIPIHPKEIAIIYWKIKEGYEQDYTLQAGFPNFVSYGNPHVYGTTSLEYPGLIKISISEGHPCDPDKRKWVLQAELIDSLREWIRERFGEQVEYDAPVLTQSCMYSMTPDEDFVIDFLGGEFQKNVVVAGGFSGHGFKMGPAIGRVVADLVLHGNASGVEFDYFKLERFDKNPRGNIKGYTDTEQSGASQASPQNVDTCL